MRGTAYDPAVIGGGAGTAVGLARAGGIRAREVGTESIRESLLAQGVVLDYTRLPGYGD